MLMDTMYTDVIYDNSNISGGRTELHRYSFYTIEAELVQFKLGDCHLNVLFVTSMVTTKKSN